MKTLSRRGSILLTAALLFSLITGCSGIPLKFDEKTTDDAKITENTEESDTKTADKQESSGFTSSTYIGDSSGMETLYSTIKYTDGLPVESYTDSCALYNAQGVTEISYYVTTSQWNSHGDLQTSETHYIAGDIEGKIDYGVEYNYNLSGNPVSAVVVLNGTSGEEEETTYVNLAMTYSEDNLLISVSADVDNTDLEGTLTSLYLQFAENAVYRVMTVDYEGETYTVTYTFDSDGNITSISCDGSLSGAASSTINFILGCCNGLSDYRDSNLAIIICDGGCASYRYNEEGDCIYYQFPATGYSVESTYEYEYTYDDDGNLSKKLQFSEDVDYFMVTYYTYE